MRSYETDSTQARARVLALAMVVDGQLHPSELKVLDDTLVMHELELDEALFRDVLDELCSDLLDFAVRDGAVEIAPSLLDTLLADIAAPNLQRIMLQAMQKVVEADAAVADAESTLLARARRLWRPAQAVSDMAGTFAA